MSYLLLKNLHLLGVGASVALFLTRGVCAQLNVGWVNAAWARMASHVSHTFLLLMALLMCYQLNMWPLYNSAWLTAKLIGLVVYIVLATLAIKRQRGWAFGLGFLCLMYIAGVAFSKSPWVVM